MSALLSPSGAAPRSIASLPGPRGLPLIGCLHQFRAERAHLIFESWARQYGPVYKVPFGRRLVVILSDHEATMKGLRARPDDFTRSRVILPLFAEMGLVGVFAAEGDEWRRQRPLVVRALDPAHLKRFFPTVVIACERLHRRWQALAVRGEPIDVRSILARYTVDVISSLAFGTDVATLERDEPDPLQADLDRLFTGFNRRLYAPFPGWRWFKTPADRKLEKSLQAAIAAVHGYIENARAQIAARPQLATAPENLLHALLAATQDERLSENELVANVFTLLLAGEDTTAGTLAWALYLLALNPDVQEAVRREAHAAIGEGLAVSTFEATRLLPLTEAVVLEALRLKPVAPLQGMSPIRDTVLAGVALPAGARVIALTRPPGLDPQRFPEPEVFKPQRWLDANGQVGESGARRAVIPFGAGPRFCPGRYLATLEAKMALATTVKGFELSATGETVQEVMSFTMHPGNLRLRLTPRAGAESKPCVGEG
jgi:cytochrome P450